MISNEILQKFTESDIEIVISIYAKSEVSKARHSAAAILLQLLRANDPRLPTESRTVIAKQAGLNLRAECPDTELSGKSYLLLEIADPAAAEEFILSVPPKTYKKGQLISYITALKNSSSDRKVAKLKELQQAGGKAAHFATKALEDLGRSLSTRCKLSSLTDQGSIQPNNI